MPFWYAFYLMPSDFVVGQVFWMFFDIIIPKPWYCYIYIIADTYFDSQKFLKLCRSNNWKPTLLLRCVIAVHCYCTVSPSSDRSRFVCFMLWCTRFYFFLGARTASLCECFFVSVIYCVACDRFESWFILNNEFDRSFCRFSVLLSVFDTDVNSIASRFICIVFIFTLRLKVFRL